MNRKSSYLLMIVLAVALSSLVLVLGLADWTGAFFFAGGILFLAQAVGGHTPFSTPPGRRTLIIGTGERAKQLLQKTRRSEWGALRPIGLADLGGARQGRTISGVPVLGTVDDLPRLAEKLKADFAIIALEPEDATEMRRVVDQCIAGGLEFKMLPSSHELMGGTSSVEQLRNVGIADILGRAPVNLDLSLVAADLRNRVILLTGAAGSIGSELARQIARFGPARVVLLDQAESDLYFVHLELSEAFPRLDLAPVICDITNATHLAQVYAQHRPDYIIHAAAYKHVPLMESNALEAVRNNVLGTLLVATTAVRYGARKVLLVSTDKAIRPASVMGATKRIAERIIFGLPNLHRSGTDFRAVRFGNVLASKGSVIPVFERQLAAGGPITVTDPLVERYFMTIPEAAQLVLQAGSLPETAGAIAMLEMGEPIRVLDLAEKLIRFSGRVPGKDVRISFTGLRPGEKLTEDQVSAQETTIPTSSPKIRVSQTTESAGPELVQKLSRLFAYLDEGNRESLLATVCDLVPECVSPLLGYRAERVPLSEAPNARASGAWQTVMASSQPSCRERRGRARTSPSVDLPIDERRQGVVCRRKDARAGGRRSTDVGVLLGAASSAL